MFQITEFENAKKKMNTEWGNMTYGMWLERERKRMGGWVFVIRRIIEGKMKVALFYKRDRRAA